MSSKSPPTQASGAAGSAGAQNAPAGPAPMNYEAFGQLMDALDQPQPDPAVVWSLFGKLGPEGQRMAVTDGNIGPKLRSVGAARPAIEDSSGWGDLASGAAELATGLSNPVGWAVGQLVGGEEEEGAPEATAAPASAAPEIASAPAAPSEAPLVGVAAPEMADGAPYFSQRDNTYDDTLREPEQKDRVEGDNMCNVTCLAMQLVAVCGSNEAVNRRTAELIDEHGGSAPGEEDLAAAQPEDLLMQLFDVLNTSGYWAGLKDTSSAPFYKGWYDDVPGGWKFHQAGVCQAHVLKWYKGVGKAENQSPKAAGLVDKETKVTDFRTWFLDVVRPQLQAQATMTLSTKLTGGHFVLLTEVLDDGVVVNDPFGARGNTGYLSNGSVPKAKFLATERPVLEQRFRENPKLAGRLAAEEPEATGDWGEQNYFSWDEVGKWKIGVSGVLVAPAESGASE